MWRAPAASFMKAILQLGFLKLPGRPDSQEQEDQRVLALFRKRAELKKAHGELQDEIFRLKDRIKQQEGATQRVQEMLGALEARLGSQDAGYPALVFYQLRRFWQAGREQIEQFVADLARQVEERERRAHFAEVNRRQFAQRQAAETQLRATETDAAEARSQLVKLQTEHAQLTRFWHYFKRRALDSRIDTAQNAVRGAESALTSAREAMEALENEAGPGFAGLSVEARRAINLAAIAYAETLCLRLVKTPLVTMAREATGRREVTDEYGSRPECEALMLQISRALGVIQNRTNIAQEVKVRAERLKLVARYRNPTDTVPSAESVAFSEGDVMDGQQLGTAAARMPNVIAEDTWDLFRIVLR
jgi:hypothetical protein